jgi:cytochrome c peroxidase
MMNEMRNVGVPRACRTALMSGVLVIVACSEAPSAPTLPSSPTDAGANSSGNGPAPGTAGAGSGSSSDAVGGGGRGGAAPASGGALNDSGGQAGQSGGGTAEGPVATPPAGRDEGPFPNTVGEAFNVSVRGPIDRNNEFFKGFGNGRACVTCHRPEDGFSITPATVRALFKKCGLDSDEVKADVQDDTACALFRTSDGANSPTADVSTAAARRAAYSLLLSRGLIRMVFPVLEASKRQYDVVEAHDPYGVGSTTTFSVYRRPLPATNLTFASGIMWDFRETSTAPVMPPFTPDVTKAPALSEQLRTQAINAALDHGQAMSGTLTEAQVKSIVDFELTLFSAQSRVSGAGDLTSAGASGGVLSLVKQPVTPVCGNLDVYDNNPMYPQCQTYTFDPNVFTLFKAWEGLQGDDPQTALRTSIARGQTLFNTKKAESPTLRDAVFFNHQGDNKNLTCSTCHASFNVGTISVPVAVGNVAVGVEPSILNAPNKPVDSLDKTLPYYKLRCNANGMATFVRTKGAVGCHDGTEAGIAAEEITVNDPGRAAVAGSWTGAAAFKSPALRNLSAHAPYFHDGSAATLADVVARYDTVLGFSFTETEKADLVNFLSAL